MPKAILHQLCQRSGWDAPKYNKIQGTGDGCNYTVSVIRKTSGRGKNRKVGGLTTLQLPALGETFETAEVYFKVGFLFMKQVYCQIAGQFSFIIFA